MRSSPTPPALLLLQGLAFVVHRKVGLLGGMNWGRGCIVTRLGDGTWSAPCFFRVRHCSLGLTFGAQRTTCCHVLQVRLGCLFRCSTAAACEQQACCRVRAAQQYRLAWGRAVSCSCRCAALSVLV